MFPTLDYFTYFRKYFATLSNQYCNNNVDVFLYLSICHLNTVFKIAKYVCTVGCKKIEYIIKIKSTEFSYF
jgi:hypothetical protein